MRIIEQPIEEHIVICDKCKTKIGYEDDDTYEGALGRMICCPKCTEDIYIDRFDVTCKFPDAFYLFAGDGTKKFDNDDYITNECIKGIKWCAENNADNWVSQIGNLKIIIQKYYDDDEETDYYYQIDVMKNFYELDVYDKDLPYIMNQ